jgi:hypothetical protein
VRREYLTFSLSIDQNNTIGSAGQLRRGRNSQGIWAVVSKVASSSSIVPEVSDILGIGVPFLLRAASKFKVFLRKHLAFSELNVGHQASKACKVPAASWTVQFLLVRVHLRRVRWPDRSEAGGGTYEIMVLFTGVVTLEILAADIAGNVTTAAEFVVVVICEALEGEFTFVADRWFLSKDLLTTRGWHGCGRRRRELGVWKRERARVSVC